LLSNGLVAMRDTLEDACDELHLVTLAGWHVGRPGQRHGGQWEMYAFDTTEKAHIGRRSRDSTDSTPRARARARRRVESVHEIKKGLVDGELLYLWRVTTQDVHYLPADASVLAAVHRDEDRLRTQSPGGPKGHRGTNAEHAGLVGGGTHYAAVVGPASANDDWLAAERGIVALLDGGEERVEIDVQDRSW